MLKRIAAFLAALLMLAGLALLAVTVIGMAVRAWGSLS
jgi:hypothetical protein